MNETTAAIDHKGKAHSHLDMSQQCYWDEPADQARVTLYLASAQVHATLYLAEQQRIANLIEWTTRDGHQPTADVQKRIEDGLGL